MLTGLAIDEAMTNGVTERFWWLVAIYTAIVVMIAVCVWRFIVLAGQVATGYAHDIRRASFAHLQELSFSYFDQRPVGWLMARLTSDTTRLAQTIPWFLLDVAWGTTYIVGMSIVMLWMNWKLALLVMSVMPIVAMVSVVFQKKLLKSQRLVRKTNSRMTGSYNEAIMGARTTKALGREDENLAEFQVLSRDMYGHSVRNSLQAAVYLPLVITLGSVGVGLALWRGGVDLGTAITLGTLVAFMQYAANFYAPVQELAERFTQLQSAQASAERLQSVLDTVSDVVDSDEALDAMARVTDPAEGMASDGYPDRLDIVEFENVSFEYKPGEPVLIEFNVKTTPGETIALVGATGSGKSTTVSLLSRFYEPTDGRILIDGVDYRHRSLKWLQSQLGIVLQSPHLFSGSVRENIRYGRLDATDDEVEAAAKLVNADAFIRQLDGGYNSDVGEGGNRLSTGQKQLVSLARAVLADPRIFILDEATSSVDTETERLIQDGIQRVLDGRLSFIIAHRLSTIRAADRILVIDKGRVIEEGNHEELLALRGSYYSLYTNQFMRESQEEVLATGSPSAT
jgi:ATP-binding cassette subfamily B protein